MNQALAMEMPNEDPDLLISEEDNIEDMYLTFAVGGEHYGVHRCCYGNRWYAAHYGNP